MQRRLCFAVAGARSRLSRMHSLLYGADGGFRDKNLVFDVCAAV
jgi:hypothetical protein